MKTIIIDGIEYNLTPKVLFKEGDFVVIQETTYLISKIEGLNVTLSCNGRNCLFDIDVLKNARLWDVTKDAKDGDVLSYRNGQWIFIYKDIVTKDTFKYYVLLSERGVSINDTAFSLLLDGITPTTKEQYNQLFQKMKEAGYEWDAEKKELKKIEQKPVEWSEEDEKHFHSIISTIECCREENKCSPVITEAYNSDLDWLKSLKDRYTWKPSIAQLNALSIVSKGNATDDIEAIVSLYNDLKKLREE